MRSTRAYRSYPTSGVLGAGEGKDEQTTTAPPFQGEHVSVDQLQQAIRGQQPSDQPIERTLKVNDKHVTLKMTEAEMDALLQKGLAADEKFRDAAATRKEAEEAIALRRDLEQIIKGGDVDAFRRMGAAMGASTAEIEEAAQSLWGDGSEDEEWEDTVDERSPSNPRGGKGKAPLTPSKVGFEQLTPDLQRLQLSLERERIGRFIGQALDKSDIIRYNMEKYDEDGKRAIREMVEDEVRGRLTQTRGDFGDDGSHILPEVIKKVETRLKALGSPRSSISPLSLGSSPGGGDPSVYPTKKPDHVSSQDAGFDDHIEQVLAYNLYRAQQAEK